MCYNTSSVLLDMKKSLVKFILGFVGIAIFLVGRFVVLHSQDAPVVLLSEQEVLEIGVEGYFVIPFDQRMNPRSFQDAIVIEPSVDVSYEVEDATLIIHSKFQLKEGERYYVSLKKSITNFFGRPLKKNSVFAFDVTGKPSLKTVLPKMSTNKILLHFSRSMVEESLAEVFRITPYVSGDWRWITPTMALFDPRESFLPATKYRLENTKTLHTKDRISFDPLLIETFETERLELLEYSTSVGIHDPLILSFSLPVSESSVREKLLIRDQNGTPFKDISILPLDQMSFEIIPKTSWWYSHFYSLELPGLMPLQGNLSFQQPSRLVFETEPLLPLVEGVLDYHDEKKILLPFKTRPDIVQLRKHLLLFPELPFRLSEGEGQIFLEVLSASVPEQLEIHLSEGLSSNELPYQGSLVFKLRKSILEEVEEVSQQSQEVFIQRTSDTFFQFINTPEDLLIPYTMEGLTDPLYEVCELSAMRAIEIEARTLKKWSSFKPSQYQCRSFVSGPLTKNPFDLREVLTESSSGIYYVRLGQEEATTDALLISAPWTILSKKGKSAMLWVTETKTAEPVNNAKVLFYGSDGSLLKIARTDQRGLYFLSDNKMQYEYLILSKGKQEMLMNVFESSSISLEPYGIPQHLEDNPYRFVFFLEKLLPFSSRIRGVAVLKEMQQEFLKPVPLKQLTVAVYSLSERLLASRNVSLDDYGNAYFDLTLVEPLPSLQFQLSLCLGTFEGVCHGTHLWSPVDLNQKISVAPQPEEIVRDSEFSFVFQKLTPLKPLLITFERDHILKTQVVIPEGSEYEYRFPVLPEYFPELMISGSQVQDAQLQVQMKRLFFHPSIKEISSPVDPKRVSTLTFSTSERPLFSSVSLYPSFYPLQGISILSSSSRPPTVISGEILTHYPSGPQVIFFPGTLLFPSDPPSEDTYRIEVLHDNDGNFGSQTFPEVSRTLLFHSGLPDFFRPGDRFLLPFELQNVSTLSKNVRFLVEAPDVQFFPSREIMLGMSPHQKKEFSLEALFLPKIRSSPVLQMKVEAGDDQIYDIRETVPIVFEQFESPSAIHHEELEGVFSSISLDSIKSDRRVQFILSSTPATYMSSAFERVSQFPVFDVFEKILQELSRLSLLELQKSPQASMIRSVIQDQFEKLEFDFQLASREKIFWAAKTVSRAKHFKIQVHPWILRELTTRLRSESFLWLERDTNEAAPLLNALTSLGSTASDITQKLFDRKSELSNRSLLLLLLSLEDLRDYGVRGMELKIEELIEMLQRKEKRLHDTIWIDDFFTSTLYLEALVRQSSSRFRIPDLIHYLSDEKFKRSSQSLLWQASYLFSFSDYLQIYVPKEEKRVVTLMHPSGISQRVELDPKHPFRYSVFEHFLKNSSELENVFEIHADTPGPLFLEVLEFSSERDELATGKDLAIELDFGSSRIRKGQVLEGSIHLYSANDQHHLVILQEKPAALEDITPATDQFKMLSDRERNWYALSLLPSGETIIPFTWKAEFSGTFEIPPVKVFADDNPELFASSKGAKLTVLP